MIVIESNLMYHLKHFYLAYIKINIEKNYIFEMCWWFFILKHFFYLEKYVFFNTKGLWAFGAISL